MATLNLTNTQVMILKVLHRNPRGLTREDIAEKSGVTVTESTLGPVYEETVENHPDSLRAYRLVTVEKTDPGAPTIYILTEKGTEAATLYSARKRGQSDKVAVESLDKAVLKIRALKPYGLELFTDDDVKEVRELLPEDERDVTISSLRQQIVNRRKQGAYSKNRIEEPDWYGEYRKSQEFKIFSAKVRDYYGGCALCLDTDDVTVYHRDFSTIGAERVKDGIALCSSCRKRQGRFMCEIPTDNPLVDEE